MDSGWGGTITITIGAVVAAFAPPARTSAAFLWDYLLREATRVHGGTWAGFVDPADKLYIAGSAGAFTLAATGVAQTRLGLTGTYTGASAYTADVAHYGAVTPSRGFLLTSGFPSSQAIAPAASGTMGATGAYEPMGGTLDVHGTLSEIAGLEATLNAATVYDVHLIGRLQARVRLQGVVRKRLGLHGDQAFLTVATSEVPVA